MFCVVGIVHRFKWQGQKKCRSFILSAFYFHISAMVLHVFVSDKQAQPRAAMEAALVFGREIGIKDLVQSRFPEFPAPLSLISMRIFCRPPASVTIFVETSILPLLGVNSTAFDRRFRTHLLHFFIIHPSLADVGTVMPHHLNFLGIALG